MKARKYFFHATPTACLQDAVDASSLAGFKKAVTQASGRKIQVGCHKEEAQLLVSISEDMEGCFTAHLPCYCPLSHAKIGEDNYSYIL